MSFFFFCSLGNDDLGLFCLEWGRDREKGFVRELKFIVVSYIFVVFF